MQTEDNHGSFLRHEPCEKCGSSDAKSIYSSGTAYCFACETWSRWDEATGEQPTATTQRRSRMQQQQPSGLITALAPFEETKRGIKPDTFKKFNYQYGSYKGQQVHVAPYYLKGELVAQHLRTPDKEFPWLGSTGHLDLFGQHLWRNEGGKRIVITEGEIDCMSVSQVFNLKWPVVSIPSGVNSATKYIKQNLEFLESYDEIVIAFDADEPGIKARDTVAILFTPGKVKTIDWSAYGVKDANDLLKAGKGSEIATAVFEAHSYRPDGIRCGEELWDEVKKPIEWGISYPWEELTKATYGARLGELICLGAGTGMGKTDVFKEFAVHFLSLGETIGIFFLEESNKDTALSLMGKHSSKLFHIPDIPCTEEEKRISFDETLGTGRVFLYDHFGSTDYETIKQKIRFMAVANGVRYIFLDHVTALVNGNKDGDDRKELDYIMADLARLARSLKINIHLISHLSAPEGKPHEEGGRVMLRHLRGSQAIKQWCNFVFALERNQQAVDLEERHISTFRILKDRYTGRSTGLTFKLKYNQETGRLFVKESTSESGFDNEQEDGDEEGVDF